MCRKIMFCLLTLCLACICKAESTDISKLDNAIYTDNVSCEAGETLSLSIKMKNKVAMTGFQFDLKLPNGISVTQEDDFYNIELSTERTTAKKTNYFESVQQSDGSVRVMASSTKSYTFSGNDGEVVVIEIAVGEDVAAGSYPLIIKEIVMSDATSQTYEVEKVESVITVTSSHSHVYSNPVWNWTGCSAARATFTCVENDDTQEVESVITSAVKSAATCTHKGVTTYTAKVTFNSIEYSDTKDVEDIDILEHTLSIVDNGDGTHTVSCKNCDYSITANHDFTDDVCSVCGAEQKPEIDTHDNIIFFEESRQWPGKQITLPLMMNNTAEITAMQFDLILPEGITLDKNSRDRYALTFNAEAGRTDAMVHTLSSSLQDDGSIRVLTYSVDKDAFLGNSGALIDFPLTIAADVEPAEYDIVLRNIILTATDKKEYKMDEVVCKLIVPDYEMGDVNSDGEINVTDIVYVSDYILGNTDPDFNELAADMNEDNEINVTDIVYIADKILSGEEGANAKSMAKGHAAGSAMMKIDSFSMAAGNSKTVTLDMLNEGKEIVAFQCNIILSEGMSINSGIAFNEAANRTDAYTHSLATAQNAEGVKVLCYSVTNDAIAGTSGAVLNLPVFADAAMADGQYEITVSDIVMTCKDKTQLKPADVTATVSVGSATGLQMQTSTPDTNAEYYNAAGQRMGSASKGISIKRTDAAVSKVLK